MAFENNANNRCPLFRLACVAKIFACVSILTKGRTKGWPHKHAPMRSSVPFVFVNISRTVRWFYIKLGMRVYPGGIILCLDFRVTGSCCKNMGFLVIPCT